MLFPIEILDVIVANNSDSFKTLISWAQISPYYRDFISQNVAIISLFDGFNATCSYPLNYDILCTHENHISINALDNNMEVMKNHIQQQNNILIAVHSNGAFSQPLRMTLAQIAHLCQPYTNICILYENTSNFLSRLYFQEFERLSITLNLAELYIFGNMGNHVNSGLFDLTTLFETTYIDNISEINSLAITHSTHCILAPCIQNIKSISISPIVTDIISPLRMCPFIHNLGSLNFPISHTTEEWFEIPGCNNISLSNFHSGVKYPTINGALVRNKLTLVEGMLESDPTFSHLNFPNIVELELDVGITPNQIVRLQQCELQSLRILNADSAIVPWRDLIMAGCHIDTLKLKLYSFDQIKWLNECPFRIHNIEILPSKNSNIPNILFPENCRLLEMYDNITLNADTLTHYNILQSIVLPNININQTLSLSVNEREVTKAMKQNPNFATIYSLYLNDSNGTSFKIPYLHHFKVSLVQEETLILDEQGCSFEEKQLQSHIPALYHFHNSTLGVHPKFQSLISEVDTSSRRGSNFSTNSTFSNDNDGRRRSTLGSLPAFSDMSTTECSSLYHKILTFEFVENLPDVISVDMDALEKIKFDVKNVQPAALHLIRINITICEKCSTPERLQNIILRRAIEAIEYPLSSKFPNIIIERLQLVINFNQTKLNCNLDWIEFTTSLQRQVHSILGDVSLVGNNIIPKNRLSICLL